MEEIKQKRDDEISLIEIGTIIYDRKRLFTSSFLIILITGILFIFSKQSVHSYSSLFHIGQVNNEKPLEHQNTIKEKILKKYSKEVSGELGFSVPLEVSVKGKSNPLISIESNSSLFRPLNEKHAKKFHSKLLGKIQKDHKKLVNNIRSFNDKIMSSSLSGPAEAIKSVSPSEIISKGESQTSSLISVKTIMYLAISSIVGFFVALFLTLFAEFFSQVKKEHQRKKHT